MLLICPNLIPYIFYIIYSGKNNGPKSRTVLPVKIITAQLCKKILKNLIIGRTVYLINN